MANLAVKKIIRTKYKHCYKGDAGRICVIGGSKDYTGAPYLAALASLRTGADLCYVWTTSDAALAIKSYSPDVIVSPILDGIFIIAPDEIKKKLSCVDSVIIGPGLGRSEVTGKIIKLLVSLCVELNKPLVLDADSLYYINNYKKLIATYSKCILTPNHKELKHLLPEYTSNTGNSDYYDDNHAVKAGVIDLLKAEFPNNTIICKGRFDVIINGEMVKYCSVLGATKRAGGQGDILCGMIGTFFSWINKSIDSSSDNYLEIIGYNGYEACILMRKCANEACAKYMRGMIASDILNCIPSNFNQLFINKYDNP